MYKLLTLFEECLQINYTTVENDASFAITFKGDELTFFFERSRGVQDWKNNFDFPIKPYTSMNSLWFAHRGFLKVWKSVEPYIKDIVMTTSAKKITIVGYSHGGALAGFAHEYIWFNRPDLRDSLASFGFGAPRIYWGILPKKLKERWNNYFVIRNAEDLVTFLPPCWLGYQDIGNLIQIGENSSYSRIDAHRPNNYINSLTKFQNINL